MTTLPTSDERILKANGLSNALSGLSEGFNKHTTKGGSEFADALHGFAKGFAPEQYEAGRQNAYTSKIGNALKGGDMNAASDLMFDAGRLQDGLNMRSQVQSEQQAEQSKGMQQAMALGQHLLQMPDEQSRAAFVSQNWQTFAPMLGANSLEEYLANDPTAFSDADLQNDLRQLQVQMGQGPTGPNTQVINGQVVDMDSQKVLGDYRDPQQADARRTIKGADGYQYYMDTGERVLPDVVRPETEAESANVQSTFTGDNGNIWMVMRDGSVRDSGVGEQDGFTTVDLGGGVKGILNRYTGAVTPINSAESAAVNQAIFDTTTENESDRRQAEKDLPKVIEKAEDSINVIDDLLDHEGFDSRYGFTSYAPAIRGTSGAGAQAYIDQIAGQAFLQAFETLKGGGHITEIEGDKATAAINRATNQGISSEEARKALNEFKGIIKRGVESARAAAGQSKGGPPGTLGEGMNVGELQIAIGAVEDGYRYIGGDPGDPNSWEPVQ